ncbi:trehalose-phosphatase [Cnuibacter sp. UC19_7]|uniref:trehalose-phosphatase n=1 Tax=Cnuibacter sp. UC19_7 TaxID=3350166 RepID=UPI00366E48FA
MSTASDDLDQAIERLATTEHLLVALDFDGTLSPIVERPEEARALPEADEALRALVAAPDTTVVLVSGRSMASLEHVTGSPEHVRLVGSHGVEVKDDDGVHVELDGDERARRDALHGVLESAVAGHAGVWVEEKPAGFAVHTRRAAADVADAARRAARAAAEDLDGLTEREGKGVIEFSVKSTSKGDSLRMLRERTGATAVLFAGDDVTDEDGFAALGEGDVGLKVGPGDTAASHRLDDPAGVAGLLARLAARRTAR